MRTRMAMTAALAAATLALAPAASAQEGEWWTEWDNDEDGLLSDQEFATVYSNSEIFDDMDPDADGVSNVEDIIAGGYMSEEAASEADTDQDGTLTEEETITAIFLYLDADESGMLDEEELRTVREPSDMTGTDG